MCNSCGKICKNAVGLKIHQTKMGCEPRANLLQRAEILSGQTEEIHSQEEHHRAENVNASGTAAASNIPVDVPTRQKVKWPRMNDTSAWKAFEDTTDEVLETTLAGTINRKIESFTTILYTVGRETFGTEETKAKSQGIPSTNRREAQIRNIRRDLKAVKKQWKQCAEHEKEGIKAISDDLRKQLQSLRTA